MRDPRSIDPPIAPPQRSTPPWREWLRDAVSLSRDACAIARGTACRYAARCANAEAIRTAGWFRSYYFANREAIAPDRRARIEALLAAPTIDRCGVSELAGLIVGGASPAALVYWRRLLDDELRFLLDSPDAEASRVGAISPSGSLRDEVAMLLGCVTRLRSVRRSLSQMRTACCAAGLLIGFVYVLISLRISGVFGQARWISLLAPILLLGGLGGLTSGVSRLYSIRWRGPSLLMYTHVTSLAVGLMLNVLLAAFEGGVFALILYAFFTTGYLRGPMFPSISWGDAGSTDWLNYVTNGGPDSPADVGKVVIWSFIAGFSERLVPDLIRQLTAQAKETAHAGPTKTPAGE